MIFQNFLEAQMLDRIFRGSEGFAMHDYDTHVSSYVIIERDWKTLRINALKGSFKG